MEEENLNERSGFFYVTTSGVVDDSSRLRCARGVARIAHFVQPCRFVRLDKFFIFFFFAKRIRFVANIPNQNSFVVFMCGDDFLKIRIVHIFHRTPTRTEDHLLMVNTAVIHYCVMPTIKQADDRFATIFIANF